jgi:hypothetical protein
MRKQLALRNCVLLWFITLALSPCAAAQVIPVSNVEELYQAVNNPGNAGATLLLSTGTYPLSATDPNGVPRPNGGRIELQRDMSLIGVEGDRTLVIIDAFNLPASSFPQTAGPNAAVRMGLGRNSLEWLTIRNARFGQANIDSGLQPLDAEPAVIWIAHVASSGSARGINLLNFGPQTSGQTIEADVIDSYFFDNTVGLQAQGVRIGNFQGAQGSIVNVRMSGCLVWGQKTGLLVANNLANQSTVNVFSSGNRFFNNGAGTILIGGFSSNNNRADGNTIHFEAHGDRFLSNTAPSEFDRGGLIAIGTENTSSTSGGGSSNTVNIKLWGCRMLENTNWDLAGIGARSVPTSTASFSQNNRVIIEIHGAGQGKGHWQPVEFFAHSLPAVPNVGNSVTVIR